MMLLTTNFLISFAAIVLLFFSPLAYASFPDITGTFTGSVSGTNSGCSPSSLNGPFTDSFTSVFSNQSGASFDITIRSNQGDDFVVSGNGSFTGQNTFTAGPLTGTKLESTNTLNINATVGNNITFTFDGSNRGGDGCSFSGTGTVVLGGAGSVAITSTTPGSTLTTIATTSTFVQGLTNSLNNRIGDSLRGLAGHQQLKPTTAGVAYEGRISGLSAGDSAISYGVWVSYSYAAFDNDLSSTAIDGSSHSVLTGVDFAPWESTVLGLAIGYDLSDTDTLFNSGNVKTDTFTIAPYFGALLSDTWSMDFSLGFSFVEFDQFRTPTGSTTRVTSEPTADRWFGAFNLNGLSYYDNWIIGGRIGVLWSKTVLEDFTESDGTSVAEFRTKLGTYSAAADVAYRFNAFEPFIGATYSYDYNLTEIAVGGTGAQPANDQDDVLLTAGVRYFGNNSISANLEYSKRLDREDFSEDRLSLSLRIDF